MSEVKKSKYKVIKKHTLNHKVGDVIELTEQKAIALVGKVEPVKEIEQKPRAKSKKAAK